VAEEWVGEEVAEAEGQQPRAPEVRARAREWVPGPV
jgi:hypothetical protein